MLLKALQKDAGQCMIAARVIKTTVGGPNEIVDRSSRRVVRAWICHDRAGAGTGAEQTVLLRRPGARQSTGHAAGLRAEQSVQASRQGGLAHSHPRSDRQGTEGQGVEESGGPIARWTKVRRALRSASAARRGPRSLLGRGLDRP